MLKESENTMSLTTFQQIFIIALGAMQGYKYKRKFAWKIHDIHKFICGWFHLNIKYQQIYQIMLDMVKSGEYVDGYYDLCFLTDAGEKILRELLVNYILCIKSDVISILSLIKSSIVNAYGGYDELNKVIYGKPIEQLSSIDKLKDMFLASQANIFDNLCNKFRLFDSKLQNKLHIKDVHNLISFMKYIDNTTKTLVNKTLV